MKQQNWVEIEKYTNYLKNDRVCKNDRDHSNDSN